MADENQDQYEEAAHVLPRWVNYLIEHWLLSCLLLAEAYLLGTLMTLGWVNDIESPSQWGWYHFIGVALFFAAGATAAGVALRCSVTAVGAFKKRQWGFALFNLLGLFVFSGVEIWASLSERSTHLHPTPADAAVLNALGFQGAPISPTIVMVAILLPFASIYYGFSQQARKAATVAQTEEEAVEFDRKIERAKKLAELRAVQAQGARKVWQAARGKEEEVLPAAVPLANGRRRNGLRSPS